MKLTAEVETITPAQAAKYLANNPMNRILEHHLVRLYARMMREKKWKLIPAPIVFSKEGYLLQGQHRLSGQCDSKTSQQYLVCRGVDKDVFALLDAGQSRNGSDSLFIEGFNYPQLYSSLVQQYLKYENGSFWGKGNKAIKPTAIEILDYAKENKAELAKTINFVKGVAKRTTYFSERKFAVSYHIIRNHTNEETEKVMEFFKTMIGNEDEECSDSQIWLRDEMIADQQSNRKLQYQNLYSSIFYAWNGYVNGKFIKINPEVCRDIAPI